MVRDEPEPIVDLAYDHAKSSLDGQRARLDNLRSRAGTVITAASVLASFLGGQALADTTRLSGTANLVPDRGLQPWGAVGFGAFLLCLALNAWIVRPRKEQWIFRLNANKILDDQLGKEKLARYMEGYYAENEPKIKALFKVLQASIVLLGVEAIGFMVDLIT